MDALINRKIIGNDGEKATATFLEQEGFAIDCMNYRKFYGEIDIIARKKGIVLFVEVKTRKKNYFDASLLVPPSKQRKIILVAKEYIAKHHLHDMIFRFDVSLVTLEGDRYDICYIPNAFMGE